MYGIAKINKTDLRFYKGGGSITFKVPEGQHITAIVFTGVLKSNASTGKLSGREWADNGTTTNSVTFTATETNNIEDCRHYLFSCPTRAACIHSEQYSGA